MRTRRRVRALRIGVVALGLVCGSRSHVDARALSQRDVAGVPEQGAASVRVVKRTVLPDGTVQLELSDGSTRRVPPGPPTAPPPVDANASGANAASPSEAMEPAPPPPWLKDPATNQAFLRAMGEYYEYRATGLRHRRRVFEWQLTSSKVIFVTVLLLVSAGIAFAAIQFRAGLKRAQPDGPDAVTALDVSTTGIKVSSPILGVIILVISLAFFYLYLVYVYPISELV